MHIEKRPPPQDPQLPSMETESVSHLDPLTNSDYNIESFLNFPSSSNKRLRSSLSDSPTISNISHTSLSATTSLTNSTPSSSSNIKSNSLMFSASQLPSSSNNPTTPTNTTTENENKPQSSIQSPTTPQRRQPTMAARGSHWSFIEKARFEAALQKYGPFEWDKIIRAVGTRSEKQVKAYAARYRRRKKLAAQAQLEATNRQVSAAANIIHPMPLGLPRVSLPFDYSIPTYSDVTVPSTASPHIGNVPPHLVPIMPPGATAADSVPSTIMPALTSSPLQHHPHLSHGIVQFGTGNDLFAVRRQPQYHNPIMPGIPSNSIQPRKQHVPEPNYDSTLSHSAKPQEENASLAGNLAEVERLVGNGLQVPSTEPEQIHESAAQEDYGLELLNEVGFRQ